MTTGESTKVTTANFLPALAALVLLCLDHRRGADGADAAIPRRSPRPRAAVAWWCSACPSRRKTRCAANRALSMRSPRAPPGSRPCAAPCRSLVRRSCRPAEWSKLNDGVKPRSRRHGRPSKPSRSSNQEVRELAPKLLSELGDLGSSVGVQKLEGMSRYLERFELTVQRIQQDLNGLRPASAMPAPCRAAPGRQLGIPQSGDARSGRGRVRICAFEKVTGADPEQRLKTVVHRNQQYTNSVRKAIGAAEALSKAQAAARALPAAGQCACGRN